MSETRTITATDLKNLFQSNPFTYRMYKSTRITRETNCEAIFSVFRGKTNAKFLYSPIPTNDLGVDNPFESAVGFMNEHVQEWLEGEGFDINSEGAYMVLGFHTHPSGALAPSLSDWMSYNNVRIIDRHHPIMPIANNPLMLISGPLNNSTNLEALMVQSTSQLPSERLMIDAYDFVEKNANLDFTAEVAQAYDSLPYFNAAHLVFEKSRQKLILTSDSQEKLRAFAYNPHVLPDRSTDELLAEEVLLRSEDHRL